MDGSWKESRPRMGTVWRVSRARVKCRCHRIVTFLCGKPPESRTLRVRRLGEKKTSRRRLQECPDFEHHEVWGSRFIGDAGLPGPAPIVLLRAGGSCWRAAIFLRVDLEMFIRHSQTFLADVISRPCPGGCIVITARGTRTLSPPVVTAGCRCWGARATAICSCLCLSRCGRGPVVHEPQKAELKIRKTPDAGSRNAQTSNITKSGAASS